MEERAAEAQQRAAAAEQRAAEVDELKSRLAEVRVSVFKARLVFLSLTVSRKTGGAVECSATVCLATGDLGGTR
jgi:hypothetical protein